MIKRVAWSPDADRGLARALPDSLLRAIVQGEVERGVSMLWECEDELHHAYCVTRVDTNPTEFVVVAFEGSGMMTFGKEFIAAARSRNIPLRAHVTNPVVERLLRRLTLKRSEVVLRTKVA